jgi:hypothetical protein
MLNHDDLSRLLPERPEHGGCATLIRCICGHHSLEYWRSYESGEDNGRGLVSDVSSWAFIFVLMGALITFFCTFESSIFVEECLWFWVHIFLWLLLLLWLTFVVVIARENNRYMHIPGYLVAIYFILFLCWAASIACAGLIMYLGGDVMEWKTIDAGYTFGGYLLWSIGFIIAGFCYLGIDELKNRWDSARLPDTLPI